MSYSARFSLAIFVSVFLLGCTGGLSSTDQDNMDRDCTKFVEYHGMANVNKASVFEYMNKIKHCYVDYNLSWYTCYAQINWWAFRIFGIITIIGSILVPILNSDGTRWVAKWVSILVAIAVSLSGFLGWRENWATFRTAQFHLELLERTWQLEMAEADRLKEEDEAVQKAVNATQNLINKTFEVVSHETAGFFQRIKPAENIIPRPDATKIGPDRKD